LAVLTVCEGDCGGARVFLNFCVVGDSENTGFSGFWNKGEMSHLGDTFKIIKGDFATLNTRCPN